MSGKPDDIPEDVWEAADRIWHGREEGDETPAVDVVARAILAERERCAGKAEQIGKAYGDDETGWLDCSETIAAAIRKGTP